MQPATSGDQKPNSNLCKLSCLTWDLAPLNLACQGRPWGLRRVPSRLTGDGGITDSSVSAPQVSHNVTQADICINHNLFYTMFVAMFTTSASVHLFNCTNTSWPAVPESCIPSCSDCHSSFLQMRQLKELIFLNRGIKPEHPAAQTTDVADNTSIYQQACAGGCL